MMPVGIRLKIGPFYSSHSTFLVPDRSRIVFVDLVSGVFAEQHYALTFTDGVLTNYDQTSRSEKLVGLVKLPIDVTSALIAGPGEALGLRQTRLQAETNYLNAVQPYVTAQTAAAQACSAHPEACPSVPIARSRFGWRSRPSRPRSGRAAMRFPAAAADEARSLR